MPIEGYFRLGFSPIPAAYVHTFVFLPRLGVSHEIDFLIDTGADTTSIHPRDISVLGIDYRRMRRASLTTASGIGGALQYYREEAVLVFWEFGGDTRFHYFDLHICQRTNSPAAQGLPSLLGRDFLNLCSLHLDRSRNTVALEPLNVRQRRILPLDASAPSL